MKSCSVWSRLTWSDSSPLFRFGADALLSPGVSAPSLQPAILDAVGTMTWASPLKWVCTPEEKETITWDYMITIEWFVCVFIVWVKPKLRCRPVRFGVWCGGRWTGEAMGGWCGRLVPAGIRSAIGIDSVKRREQQMLCSLPTCFSTEDTNDSTLRICDVIPKSCGWTVSAEIWLCWIKVQLPNTFLPKQLSWEETRAIKLCRCITPPCLCITLFSGALSLLCLIKK